MSESMGTQDFICPESSVYLDVGTQHYKAFEKTGSIADLDQALDAIGEACHATTKAVSDHAFSFHYEHSGILGTLQQGLDSFIRTITNDDSGEKSIQGAPQGETIYANTPQHHKTGSMPQSSRRANIDVDTSGSKSYEDVKVAK